ncbi:MAG: DnaJ domain-containing protein, partial [Acidimicrobiales bacterium]
MTGAPNDQPRALADHYAVLGLCPDASFEEIEAAFRRGARRWHPDANADPMATERMVALNEARDVLSDPLRRADYDRRRLASEPPRPRLEPAVVDFGALEEGQAPRTVTVTLLNDGGALATVRMQPEAGSFWALVSVRGGGAPAEVALLDLEPRIVPGTPPGRHRSSLRVLVDDQAVELGLLARLPEVARPAGPGQPWPRSSPAVARHRSRPALGLVLAALVLGVLTLWPGSPASPVLSRLANDATAFVHTHLGAGQRGSGPAGPAAPAGSQLQPGPPAGSGGRGAPPGTGGSDGTTA